MTRTFIITTAAALLLTALPQGAFAQCVAPSAGSANVSCTQGIMVLRQSQGRLPSIDPATTAQLRLQRQQRVDRLRQQARQNELAERRLDLERDRVNNQSYLYRDANSPLRQRTRPLGYGTRGIRRNNGVIIVGR